MQESKRLKISSRIRCPHLQMGPGTLDQTTQKKGPYRTVNAYLKYTETPRGTAYVRHIAISKFSREPYGPMPEAVQQGLIVPACVLSLPKLWRLNDIQNAKPEAPNPKPIPPWPCLNWLRPILPDPERHRASASVGLSVALILAGSFQRLVRPLCGRPRSNDSYCRCY